MKAGRRHQLACYTHARVTTILPSADLLLRDRIDRREVGVVAERAVLAEVLPRKSAQPRQLKIVADGFAALFEACEWQATKPCVVAH